MSCKGWRCRRSATLKTSPWLNVDSHEKNMNEFLLCSAFARRGVPSSASERAHSTIPAELTAPLRTSPAQRAAQLEPRRRDRAYWSQVPPRNDAAAVDVAVFVWLFRSSLLRLPQKIADNSQATDPTKIMDEAKRWTPSLHNQFRTVWSAWSSITVLRDVPAG